MKHYSKLSRRYGYEIQIPERTINIMGYRALGNDDFDLAVSLFKLNVEKYPRSANVYDSLRECYEAMGKPKLALQNYRRAVELGEENDDPNLPIYKDHLEKLKAQNDKDM
jgi:tetratricopeptide (TPR) repeat protein